MRIRFAIWENGPTCYFLERHLSELEEHGVGIYGGPGRGNSRRDARGLGLRIHVYEGQVELQPHEDGAMIRSAKGMDVWPFLLDDRGASYVVRCHVMDLDFHWRNDRWMAELPLPHLLPWPLYHEYGRKFDKREAVVREIRARIDSAQRHTGSPAIKVEAYAQNILTPRERRRLFEEHTI